MNQVSPIPETSTSLQLKFVAVANLQALVYTVILLWAAWNISPEGYDPNAPNGGTPPLFINLLICVIGAATGWLAGTLASPYDKGESSRFASYAQIIAAFLSGYLLSKIDKFLDKVLYDGTGNVQTIVWQRIGLFAAAFLITALIVYINRTYVDAQMPKPPAKPQGATQADKGETQE